MPRAARTTMAVAIAAMWFAADAGAQPLEPLAPTGGPPLTSTPVTSARSLDRPLRYFLARRRASPTRRWPPGRRPNLPWPRFCPMESTASTAGIRRATASGPE